MPTLNVNSTCSVLFSGGTSLYVYIPEHFGSRRHSLHVGFCCFKFFPTHHTTGFHLRFTSSRHISVACYVSDCTFSFLARETHLSQPNDENERDHKIRECILHLSTLDSVQRPCFSTLCNPAFIAFEHPLPTHPLHPDIPIEYQWVEIDPLITNGSNLPEYQVQQVTDQYPAMKKKDDFKSALDQWKGIQCFENDLRSFLLSSYIFSCTLRLLIYIYT